MARKNYSIEFKRQAVDLYESTPGATLKGIAADLGIGRHTLKLWVDDLGTGTSTAPASSTSASVSEPSTGAGAAAAGVAGSGARRQSRPESQAARIARLEARVRELEASETKLSTERDILRQAAKFFAQETDW